MIDASRIRNFCILAHIDHGKSTLADRLLELTATIEGRKMRAQFLDMHPLERERGITIKMQPVRMVWHPDGRLAAFSSQQPAAGSRKLEAESRSINEIVLNLIDTPGHADFSYEVSRALAAVEGVILLVDATQGVQAQTLANLHAAQREELTIIPVINKIDLPSAEIQKTEEEIAKLLGYAASDIYRVSAKEGAGVRELLDAIVEKVPAPHSKKDGGGQMRALVFDSKYDPYLGVVAHIRIVDGVLKKGERVLFMASGAIAEALEVGVFVPERAPVAAGLGSGEIGYVATGIKEPALVRVGDTITLSRAEAVQSLPGYREPEPMVFASLFPEDQHQYEVLRDALGKLKLEDAALTFMPEDSGVLGRGFRTGFLGLLHMEIIAERIKREYDVRLVLTRPAVAFRVHTRAGGEPTLIYTASRLPPSGDILSLEEPWVRAEAITPAVYLGTLTTLISATGGAIMASETLGGDRLLLTFDAPLREIVIDFYDKLKSVSHGFASFSYELTGFRPGDLVRLDIIIAGETQLSLAEVVRRDAVYTIARSRLATLKELLPAELFAIALQASVEGRVIARETIAAAKKDVTGYLYGGDRTRKMKLWKKQQKGKKRLQKTGRVTMPPEVFFKLHRRV